MADRPLIRITDPDDPAIAEFTRIRERDLTRNHNSFIAEGTVVLRLLAAAHNAGTRFRAQKILLLENRVDGLGEILDEFPEDVPVYIAKADVLDAIAGFHLHRGVLALGERLPQPSLNEALEALPARSLVVVSQGLSNHDNAGSIFRNAAAFGVDQIILDETSCDPLYRKAIRVSVGAALTVPFTRGEILRRYCKPSRPTVSVSGVFRHQAKPASAPFHRPSVLRSSLEPRAKDCRAI